LLKKLIKHTPKKETVSPRFGGKTMILGECNERITDLDGARIRRIDNQKTGTVYMVIINRETELVQIWVKMDGIYIQAFRPGDIEFLDNQLEASKLLPGSKE
jgi:hypothetical protein